MQRMVIEPYEGAGPVRLGMRREEVVAAVGAPERETVNRKGRREEHRDGYIVRYSKEATLVDEITLFPPAIAVLEGIELFAEPERHLEVCARDGQPFEHVGFLVLLNLGVLLTGFHDDDPSQRAVSVIQRGLVDPMRARFKAFKLPS